MVGAALQVEMAEAEREAEVEAPPLADSALASEIFWRLAPGQPAMGGGVTHGRGVPWHVVCLSAILF
jgi:hypothetical protein